MIQPLFFIYIFFVCSSVFLALWKSNPFFLLMASFLMLIMSMSLFVTNIEFESGKIVSFDNSTTPPTETHTTTYAEVETPFDRLFFLISIVLMFSAAFNYSSLYRRNVG